MDISSIEDVRRLVDTFYGKVGVDGLIGPIFIGVIRDDWPAHLDKMVKFWQTVLLEEHTYFGSPFVPHARMPLEARHFEVWLGLWNATVDELFEGVKATEAKWRAAKMAEMFLSKIVYYRNHSEKPIL
ncbi:group III truncated hemoglobin [Dinghuibacter silviterrae]|uniref:Hemoglobin n=1 Tax=Dinghuibacter silviterrae TaxID=1539049 RepID=A0A4R8DM26_9BACT|nr:group III truncated hemoglobin [Dinghuibacter silviterrae]TDW99019.1 hemoglobin [Dinghuibacter silviterrae]